VSGANERDPVDEFHAINSELAEHNPDLPKKPKIVVATKIDAADPKKVQKLQRWSKKNNLAFSKISSVTGEGLDELKHAVFAKLSRRPVTDEVREA
jgi:GTP-binding protein